MEHTRYFVRILSMVTPLLATGMLGSMLLLSACESTPPVQEMSDARQAIAVARKAGAAEHAPYHLRAAEQYLASARALAGQKEYGEARQDAKQARMKAMDALRTAESAAAGTVSP